MLIAIYLCLVVIVGSVAFLAGIIVDRHYYEEVPNPTKFTKRGSD